MECLDTRTSGPFSSDLLPDLHNRFSNHTMGLFEKHGIENVAYWTEVVVGETGVDRR